MSKRLIANIAISTLAVFVLVVLAEKPSRKSTFTQLPLSSASLVVNTTPMNSFSSSTDPIMSDNKDVTVNLTPGAIIQSPLSVNGKIKTSWIFEATCPIYLIDQQKNELGRSHLTTTGEWTQDTSLPFVAQINFQPPHSQTGYLIIKNDNPSGDPAKDKEYRLLIRFW